MGRHYMYAIFRRELKAWFFTPLAWLLLALLLFISAYLFLLNLEHYLQILPQLRELSKPPGVTRYLLSNAIASISIVLLVIAPILSMRLISGEHQQGSLRLLLAAPVSNWQIIVGKYFALLVLLSFYLVLIFLMPLSLAFFTSLDLGMLASAYLGLWLFATSCAALGLYMSSVSRTATTAVVASLSLLLLLWLFSLAGNDATLLTQYLALPNHLNNFLTGILDTSDLAYYLLFSSLFIFLSIKQLQRLRKNP